MLVIAVLLMAGASSPAARPEAKPRGPFLVLSLPALGTVTWRCDPERRSFFALGYRPTRLSATTNVELQIEGHVVLRRSANAEGLRFPYLSAHRQRLSFVQATEPGTLRASVTVNFAGGGTHCWAYMPPGITARVSFTPN